MHIISAADFSPILLENALFCRQNACFKNRDSNYGFPQVARQRFGNFRISS